MTEQYPTIDTVVSPEGSMQILSKSEVAQVLGTGSGNEGKEGLQKLFRDIALAVLNCGIEVDDAGELLRRYPRFSIRLEPTERGISLELKGAPAAAFVDGVMIRGLREQLFAVLRDIIYVSAEIENRPDFDLASSAGITDAVFHILRNANILQASKTPNLVVCWGGHSIPRHEYDYSKEVGHAMGLRGMDVCTGCGAGAMKAPMKGARIAHLKQRIVNGQYLGLSEPGIIASESPNPIVNELIIMPDIEKRLEAFVRVGHGIVVFPGGAGTAEEILYVLGILLHEKNTEIPFPLIFTGPESARDYFTQIDEFIGFSLGDEARSKYTIIIDDPEAVAQAMHRGLEAVKAYRYERGDAYYFNWLLAIDLIFQQPFYPTHESMKSLDLRPDREPHLLAADLRRAFSGIVSGNVKEEGVRAIAEHGPFEINGDKAIMSRLDILLKAFAAGGRMKISPGEYVPCYRIAT
jgi:predicted Rossmann-fold nucleotide-binding protein